MRFKYKLTLSYTVLALIFSLILAGTCRYFLMESASQQAESQLSYTAQKTVFQFNSLYHTMESVATELLSTPEIYHAIRILREPEKYDQKTLSESTATIQNRLRTSYASSDFYRIIFFNAYGSVIYSTTDIFEGVIEKVPEQNSIYCQEADQNLGAPVFIPVHTDTLNNSGVPVFSVIRAIQGDSLGYIMVQQKAEILPETFTLPDSHTNLLMFLPDSQVFYSSGDSSPNQYITFLSGKEDGNYRDEETSEMVQLTTASGNVRILLTMEMKYIYSTVHSTIFMVLGAVFCLFLFSVTFIIFTSTWLTKPIKEIRAQLEKTRLSNLKQGLHFHATYDEIKALGISYNNLTHRLTDAIAQEKKLSQLQLQAQFDALQAQVDPHFLYNTLNVINARGIINNDMVICDICDDLSAMLRYSNSTKHRHATVAQELEYLNHFNRLMKARFENRLLITEQVSTEIFEYMLPKITLQQIVENSIHHAFKHTDQTMEIRITGQRTNIGWYLSVEDNGEGISLETLASIKDKFHLMKENITQHQKNIELEIGQMGLPSLYARLYLLYQDRMTLTIENMECHGTRTVIYIQEEKENVHSTNC